MKKYLTNLYRDAEFVNSENIKKALKDYGPFETLLDVGCWEGTETLEWAKAGSSKSIIGIEIVEKAAKKAQEKGVKTYAFKADKDKWPIKDNSVDCIVTNQVIEHLSDLDHYFSESYRVLKKGGYIITSTNNLSSFHNIFSLFLGWAPFDLTNSSIKKLGIGNPLSINKQMATGRGSSWLHKTIYTLKWLKDWQKLYNLDYINDYGAGLYPFPASFGKYLKLYSAFFTIVCKKK